MKYIYALVIMFLTIQLNAKMITSPIDAMINSFGDKVKISKKNILLTTKQAKNISKDAKTKLNSKIFRIFKAVKAKKVLGYGVLVSKKVRSKNAVILYIINKDSILKSIEIIAFNEPTEYIPSKTWISQFDNISTDKRLRIGKEIPTITGATLSARSIVDGSRIALAFYDEILKGK
ncbi:MAG: FMN-binding protein [Sulfurimonas sp.]|nr:MAG: FMN-binding protein [Sulfurimonas sp.]